MVKSKFNSVFSRNHDHIIAPTAILKGLGIKVSRRYEYVKHEGPGDIYILHDKKNPEARSFKFKIEFPFLFEGMKIHNIEELFEAMYRTQKKFKIDSSIQTDPPPMINLDKKKRIESFISSEDPFPELEPLPIKIGSICKKIPIKRIPHPSLSEVKIVSDSSNLFDCQILFNEETNKINITVRLNYGIIRTVDDYFKNIEEITAFFEHGISILKHTLKPNKTQRMDFEFTRKLLIALNAIQNILRVEFEFPRKYTEEDIYFVKILFESFVNKRMVKIRNSGPIRFSFTKSDISDFNKDSLKKGMKMEVANSNSFTILLFGVELNLVEYKYYPGLIFDRIVDEMDTDSGEVGIEFSTLEGNDYFTKLSIEPIEEFEALSSECLLESMKNSIILEDIDFEKIETWNTKHIQ